MSGLPANPARPKTFGEYMRQVNHKETCCVGMNEPNLKHDYEVLDRLRCEEPTPPAADGIESLAKLQTWARHRFPTWYTCRTGEDYDGPTGMQCMALLWADYLAWAEAV